MCDPILVTLLKMRPHYSQSSLENATPSSGTFPLASYKEVPSPGACAGNPICSCNICTGSEYSTLLQLRGSKAFTSLQASFLIMKKLRL